MLAVQYADILNVIINIKNPTSRLVRWALRLQEYTLVIIHKAGKMHADVECLSRYPPNPPLKQLNSVEVAEAFLQGRNIATEQRKDRFVQWVLENMKVDKVLRKVYFLDADVLYQQWKSQGRMTNLPVIPKHMRLEVMGFAHDDPMSGHLGLGRTWDRIRQRFFWPEMAVFARKYVETCEACQKRSHVTKKPAGPVQFFCPEKPFDMIAVDVLGPLPRSQSGQKIIIVATDLFTKWVVVGRCRNRTRWQWQSFFCTTSS